MFENKVGNCKIEITDDNKYVSYRSELYETRYQIGDDFYCDSEYFVSGNYFIDDNRLNKVFNDTKRFIGPGVYIMDVSSVFVNQ